MKKEKSIRVLRAHGLKEFVLHKNDNDSERECIGTYTHKKLDIRVEVFIDEFFIRGTESGLLPINTNLLTQIKAARQKVKQREMKISIEENKDHEYKPSFEMLCTDNHCGYPAKGAFQDSVVKIFVDRYNTPLMIDFQRRYESGRIVEGGVSVADIRSIERLYAALGEAINKYKAQEK